MVVMFPPQLEITALSYDKGPRIAPGDNLPPPTETEQETMARFWAMEEANAHGGWDNEEEIDYAEISRKRAKERGETSLENSRNSGKCGPISSWTNPWVEEFRYWQNATR